MPGLVAIKAICYLGLKDIALTTKVLNNLNSKLNFYFVCLGSSAEVDFTCV